MSEFITATIIEKPELSADQFSYLDYSSETIAKLEAAVLSILEANGIDKDSVLFAGYSADSPKKTSAWSIIWSKVLSGVSCA